MVTMQDYVSTFRGPVGRCRRRASAGVLVPVLVLLLQGCAGGMPGLPAARAVCDNAAAQFAVGRAFGPELDRELRARSGASIVRVLSPGQAVTLEHNMQRVSLTLDGRGQVVRASCG